MVNPTHTKKKYPSREASVLLIEENRNLTGALRKKVKGSVGIRRPQFCFPEKQTPLMQGRFVCGKFRFTVDRHPWGQLFNRITKKPPQGDLVDKMKGSGKKFKRTKTYNEVDFSTFISSLKILYNAFWFSPQLLQDPSYPCFYCRNMWMTPNLTKEP